MNKTFGEFLNENIKMVIVGFLGIFAVTLALLIFTQNAQAQSGGIVIVGEDSRNNVVCYAKSMSSDYISCVKK